MKWSVIRDSKGVALLRGTDTLVRLPYSPNVADSLIVIADAHNKEVRERG